MRNLNRVIDINFDAVETATALLLAGRSSSACRADAFITLGMAFDSPEAAKLNKDM